MEQNYVNVTPCIQCKTNAAANIIQNNAYVTSGQGNLTYSHIAARARIIQSYSLGGANVYPV